MEKQKCTYWDWDKADDCGLVAKFECNDCGILLCKKHEKDTYGECPEWEPPRLNVIK